MSGVPLDSSKRCPRCGALAALNAPLCLTCGREFRGTIGQGAPGQNAAGQNAAGQSTAAQDDPAAPAPPPRLGASPPGVPPIPGLSPIDAPDPRFEEDRAAGTRISLILVAVFVVGTVLLAMIAAATSRHSRPGAAPRSAPDSSTEPSTAPTPGAEARAHAAVTNATPSLYRNVDNRTQDEAAVTLRNSGTIAVLNVGSIGAPSTLRAS